MAIRIDEALRAMTIRDGKTLITLHPGQRVVLPRGYEASLTSRVISFRRLGEDTETLSANNFKFAWSHQTTSLCLKTPPDHVIPTITYSDDRTLAVAPNDITGSVTLTIHDNGSLFGIRRPACDFMLLISKDGTIVTPTEILHCKLGTFRTLMCGDVMPPRTSTIGIMVVDDDMSPIALQIFNEMDRRDTENVWSFDDTRLGPIFTNKEIGTLEFTEDPTSVRNECGIKLSGTIFQGVNNMHQAKTYEPLTPTKHSVGKVVEHLQNLVKVDAAVKREANQATVQMVLGALYTIVDGKIPPVDFQCLGEQGDEFSNTMVIYDGFDVTLSANEPEVMVVGFPGGSVLHKTDYLVRTLQNDIAVFFGLKSLDAVNVNIVSHGALILTIDGSTKD